MADVRVTVHGSSGPRSFATTGGGDRGAAAGTGLPAQGSILPQLAEHVVETSRARVRFELVQAAESACGGARLTDHRPRRLAAQAALDGDAAGVRGDVGL